MNTIAVLANYNDVSRHAMKFAIETFGTEAKYILLTAYTFEDNVGAPLPNVIKSEVMERLDGELGIIRSLFGNDKPQMTPACEFGSIKYVLENGWKNNQFDLVVMPATRSNWFNRLFISEPAYPLKYAKVPILVVPGKARLEANQKPLINQR